MLPLLPILQPQSLSSNIFPHSHSLIDHPATAAHHSLGVSPAGSRWARGRPARRGGSSSMGSLQAAPKGRQPSGRRSMHALPPAGRLAGVGGWGHGIRQGVPDAAHAAHQHSIVMQSNSSQQQIETENGAHRFGQVGLEALVLHAPLAATAGLVFHQAADRGAQKPVSWVSMATLVNRGSPR